MKSEFYFVDQARSSEPAKSVRQGYGDLKQTADTPYSQAEAHLAALE